MTRFLSLSDGGENHTGMVLGYTWEVSEVGGGMEQSQIEYKKVSGQQGFIEHQGARTRCDVPTSAAQSRK